MDTALTVERFARDAAQVCTLRMLVECARTGRADIKTMDSWGFTEQQFFDGLSMAISISLSA